MKNKLLILLVLTFIIISCDKTVNKKSTYDDESDPLIQPAPTTTPTATITPTTTPTTRVPYSLGEFTVHGVSGHSTIWSTITDGTPSSIMVTDSRFDIRIKKYSGPPRETVDKFGATCMYVNYPYTKLKGNVRIRVNGSTIYKTKEFETDSSTGYSEILRFGDMVDFPQTSDYYVIEIVEPIVSDADCIRNPGHPDVCPYWPVPFTECYKMEVELATDYTDPF